MYIIVEFQLNIIRGGGLKKKIAKKVGKQKGKVLIGNVNRN